MTRRFKSLAIAGYGVAVIGSGLLSLLANEGGKAGLWFGLVMGTLALGAALLLSLNQRLLGGMLAWPAVGFVASWFTYDVLVKKGFAQAELRVYVVIVLSLAAAVVLCTPLQAKPKP